MKNDKITGALKQGILCAAAVVMCLQGSGLTYGEATGQDVRSVGINSWVYTERQGEQPEENINVPNIGVLAVSSLVCTVNLASNIYEAEIAAESSTEFGTVQVLYALEDGDNTWDDDSCAVLKLTNGICTKYGIVKLSDRNQDGEHIKLEKLFSKLPSGVYTVTEEYIYTKDKGIIKSGSDSAVYTVGVLEDSETEGIQQEITVCLRSSSKAVSMRGGADHYIQEEEKGFYA